MRFKKELSAFFTTLFLLGSLIVLAVVILIILSANNNINISPITTTAGENNTSAGSLPTEPAAQNEEAPESLPSSCSISFSVILQKPELPTGCEVTSLAMLLNYLGYDVDKLTLADEFLPKAAYGTASIYDAFVGDPRDNQSNGCFSPVIVKCAAAYLKTQNSALKIYNYTGSDPQTLYEQISLGHPCIVWATINMLEPYPAGSWIVNDEICQWYAQEHCMVLIGYDFEKNQVMAADPLQGITTYDLELFETRYNQMFRQAICIY